MPLLSSGRSGALVSATSTSPFGSTYNQRGWSSPLAKAVTASPAAGFGLSPPVQPLATAMLTVGSSVSVGSGIGGFAPVDACSGNLAESPQPASSRSEAADNAMTAARMGHLIVEGSPD